MADRHTILKLIDNAISAGARLSGVCAVLEISPRTVRLGFDFCRPKIGDFAVFFLNRSFKIKAPRVAWSFPNR